MTLVVNPQDIGLATGVLGSIRALAGAVAQAIYVSVLNNELKTNVPTIVGGAATKSGLPPSSLVKFLGALTTGGSLKGIPGATPSVVAASVTALKIAYSRSFQIVFYCTVPFSVIMIAASCFVPNMGKLLHYNVAKRLQRKVDSSSTHVDLGEHEKQETPQDAHKLELGKQEAPQDADKIV